ncbi:hypothetical protein D3C72_1426680 [compost metagenome]
MEGAQQLERIDDAIVRRPDRPGDIGTQAGHERSGLVMIQELPFVGLYAGL